MQKSNCTVSFNRNDLQKTRLLHGQCPVKNCTVNVERHKVPFQRFKGKMRYLPYCSEHGIRIHNNGFVYFNGSSKDDLTAATKRNITFSSDYYVDNFLKKGNKMESGRLCYESSEDAVSYNVFTAMLADQQALRKLVKIITNIKINNDVEVYLWGGKIDLKNNTFKVFKPLVDARKHLEGEVRRFGTEPDIMLVVPKKLVICIEAKLGSKNPIAKEKEKIEGEKPTKRKQLIARYCEKNRIIDTNTIFDLSQQPKLFYEQLFRNIVFSATMAKLEGHSNWYVVNLRNQHVMNIKKGKPESMPIMRNMRSILRPKYKKRFTHLTWEDIYNRTIKDREKLVNLAWYMKNKSLGCGRAFNAF